MRAHGAFAPPAFTLVLMFAVVVMLPVSAYLYWMHSAWSWLYLIDPAGVPGVMAVPVVVAVVGALVGSWLVAALLLRADRERTLWGAMAGVGLTLVISTAALSGRIGAYGSFEVFRAGEAVGLLEVKLGYVLITLFLGVGAAAAFVSLELRRDGRQARLR
ncbi:hypothetical protein [Haliangium sp.]|uniref:hypothetical protein n=1 Tax=Haliangium sp. TaxID=2663208 RepID=UPI003D0D9959